MLSQVTRLLALVSAPPLEAATVRHVEVLLLQPQRRDGRRDHLDRRRHQARVTRSPSRSTRARRLGGRVPERAARRRSSSARACSAARLDEPALSPRERAFLDVIRPALRRASTTSSELYVGGAAGLLDDLRAEEIGAYREPDRGRSRSAPRCSTCSRSSLDPRRPFVRVGDELEQPGAARARARRRDATASRTTRSARSACSGRCAWTTRRRSAPSARPRTSSRASSKTSTRESSLDWHVTMATTERDYYELLGVSARRRRAARSRRRSAGSRASCTPTSRRRPTRRSASARSSEAYEVLSNAETRAALRPLRPRRPARRRLHAAHFDFGNLSRPLLRLLRRRPLRRRPRQRARGARHRAPRSRSSSPRRRAASRAQVPFAGRRHRATTCDGNGAEPGTSPIDLPDAAAAPAGCSRSRAASSASSSARRPAPTAAAAARSSSTPCGAARAPAA